MHSTPSSVPIVNCLVVIGLGLIGSSFAKGVRDAGLAQEVVGVDLDPHSRKRAVELGVADRCCNDLAEACKEADVIMLAVPVLALQTLLGQIADLKLTDTIITDVGSVKGHLLTAAQKVFGVLPPLLVPGHPIAGSERSGVEAANSTLFKHHKVILTPHEQTNPDALRCVQQLWQGLGADVESMS